MIHATEYERHWDNFYLSCNPYQLDIRQIHGYLTNSYWANGISEERVAKAIKHSLSFGVYLKTQQVGFARIVTDFTRYALLLDVFVIEEFQRKGVGSFLIRSVLEHPELQNLRRIELATRDAQEFYSKFGFREVVNQYRYMEIKNEQCEERIK